MPISPTDYIHRVGRTGRAGLTGKAISFVSSSPIMLNFGGRFVEHNEQQILQKIRSATGKSLHYRKVPGPWSDNPRDVLIKYDELKAQKYDEKQQKEISKLLNSKEEKVLGKGMLDQLQARAEARKKNPTRARYLPTKELTKGLTLRKFRHGRYEDMIVDYDITRARNRGVIIPDSFTKKVNTMKKKR